MGVVKLKKLILKNFKGIKNLCIDFGNITGIYGENNLGKTSIYDGFTWLLFNKDSRDRSKFDIQPLDKSNNIIHMLDTEASAIFEVNGEDLELKKMLKEKWVKKDREANLELRGTETLFYINQIPVNFAEFSYKISSIIDEHKFKQISNPLYFNFNMLIEERRKLILDIIGDITAEKVINYDSSLRPLLKHIKHTDISMLRQNISAKLSVIKEEKKKIPCIIEVIKNSIDPCIDFDALEFRKHSIKNGISYVEEKIKSGSINYSKNELKVKKDDLVSELEAVENCLDLKGKNIRNEDRIATLLKKQKELEQQITDLEREEYLCEKYVNSRIELIESTINSKFKFVKFKLFNTLISGGIDECYQVLIDGIPFYNVNTASQVNAGIEIINVLSEHYNISVPVFIDNREKVNKLLKCTSQTISLVVSRDKEFVIKNFESEVA